VASDVVTCDRCGARAPGPGLPLTWGTSQERGTTLRLCERCVRDNVRAIESKLDSEWW
jgi:hypothetical protein